MLCKVMVNDKPRSHGTLVYGASSWLLPYIWMYLHLHNHCVCGKWFQTPGSTIVQFPKGLHASHS